MKKWGLDSFNRFSHHPLLFMLYLAVAILPFLYVFSHFYGEMQTLDELEERLERLQKKALLTQAEKEKEQAYVNQIQTADPFYLDKQIESLVFLEPSIKKLQGLCQSENSDDPMKSRLQFLKEGSNKLLFAETTIRQNDLMQEAEEKLQHTVELDDDDLKKLLSLIEGIPIGPYIPKTNRPQMLIKTFDLSKKKLSSQDEVFILDLELIKREQLKKT